MATFTQIRDELKTCPYNPLHKVAARRLAAHIVKCGRNPDNPVLEECPFNALHRVPPNQLKQHILTCRDSLQIIREIEESRSKPPVIPTTERSDCEPPLNPEVPDVDRWEDDYDYNCPNYVTPGLLRPKSSDNTDDKSEEPFTLKSNIEIQCMKKSDRQLYYKELIEKAKTNQLPKTNSELRMEEEMASIKAECNVWEDSDRPSNVRKPNATPFKNKIVGIGRGKTPPVNPSPSIRPVGSSSSPYEKEQTVKRQKSDGRYFNAGRFSDSE